MALSFGRGKKGENSEEVTTPAPSSASAGSAKVSTTKASTTDSVDESWFDAALEEEKVTSKPSPFAAPSVPSSYATIPDDSASEFDIFAELEDPIARPARPAAAPATSFNMADVTPTAAAPASEAFGAADATPFDNAVPGAPAPAKGKGGLKKILPIIGVVAVLGGGAYFWISQQNTGTDEMEPMAPPTTSMPPAPPGPPPGPPAKPPAQPPTTAATGAAPSAPADPKLKAQLKKLWDDGAAAKKAGKNADARKKWQEAVKLAKSKPGNDQSAKLIQEAIDKLK